jgi:anthranilate phosphoribosyltransferase
MSPKTVDGVSAKTPQESAGIIRGVLEFKRKESPEEDLVIANSMAAFYIAGYGDSLDDTFGYAVDGIKNGHALNKLNALAKAVSL